MFKWLTIISTLVFVPVLGCAQHLLNGIWKGYFITGFGDSKQYYKYEMQIVLDDAANRISGISYSYLSTDFYGKTQLDGSYNAASKKLDVREAKLVSFSNTNSSNVCLMHSTLTFLKIGNDDILEGTFTSVNSVTNAPCGQGYIHLERSTNSDFHTEPFLAKTKRTPNRPQKYDTLLAAKTYKPDKEKALLKARRSVAEAASIDKTVVKQDSAVDADLKQSSPITYNNPNTDANPPIKSFASIPEYFQKRRNKLVKTIVTHTPEVDISFYDNGEVDDDSITVYHNLNPVVVHGRLSRQSIDYGFDASDDNRLQSFIIVADNLGKIPPNSALMVVYTNHQRYEVFIESDLKTNGEVRIVYEPTKK
ncbi:MAG: hypothetical protein QM610_06345 [Chitinophagaceae bacterium]